MTARAAAGRLGWAAALAAGVALQAEALRQHYARHHATAARWGVMDHAEHVRRVDRALAYDPAQPEANRSRAELLIRAGKPAEAAEAALTAMKTNRPLPDMMRLAAMLDRAGRPDEARRWFETVRAGVPGYPPPVAALAGLALKSGDTTRALALADELSKCDFHSPDVPFIRARVAEAAGDSRGALAAYMEVSAAGETTGTMYRLADVRARVAALWAEAPPAVRAELAP